MRYIKKTEEPDFFLSEKFSIENWKKFRDGKRKLKKYMMEREQKYICAYCETRIDLDNSHIEHIKPQSLNKYQKEVFNYYNLVVSCNGREYCNLFFIDSDYKEFISCGHKKADNFDENLFISPIKEKNCSKFFVFDKEKGTILPNKNLDAQSIKRAEYTISILSLDNFRLNQARLNMKRVFEKKLWKIRRKQGKDFLRSQAEHILSSKKKKIIPFISFLRFYFYRR